jgi:hypothetical protein
MELIKNYLCWDFISGGRNNNSFFDIIQTFVSIVTGRYVFEITKTFSALGGAGWRICNNRGVAVNLSRCGLFRRIIQSLFNISLADSITVTYEHIVPQIDFLYRILILLHDDNDFATHSQEEKQT